MKQKNDARRRDQRRRETFFRERREVGPRIIILGPLKTDLKEEIERELFLLD